MENNNSDNFSIEQLFCFSNNRFSAVEKETHDNADNAADNDNDDDNNDNNDQDDNDNDNDDDDADDDNDDDSDDADDVRINGDNRRKSA